MAKPKHFYTLADGRTFTQQGLATHLGISTSAVRWRVNRGRLAAEHTLAARVETACEPPPLPAHGLHYCAKHEQALCHTETQGWHWAPLARATVAVALAYAEAFGCQRQLVLRDMACPQCPQEPTAPVQ